MAAPYRQALVPAGPHRWLGMFVALLLLLSLSTASAEKTLTIGTPILTPNGANPYQALGYAPTLALSAVFDPLTVIDFEGRIRPWLAVDWWTEDSINWLITLRDNVVFSNGQKLDAAVLVASVQHMKTLAGRSETIGSNLADITRIEAVAERQVLVTLKAPDPVFPVRLSLWRIPEPVSFPSRPSSARPIGSCWSPMQRPGALPSSTSWCSSRSVIRSPAPRRLPPAISILPWRPA
jgi:ABC-type transport system substrate-binding protein